MKTKEELNEIKEEIEKLDTKLHELTEEELEQVTGGIKAYVASPGVGIDKLDVDNSGTGFSVMEELEAAKATFFRSAL